MNRSRLLSIPSASLLFALVLPLWVGLNAHSTIKKDSDGSDFKFVEAQKQESDDALHKEIEAILQVQTQAWNDGDLVKFMSTYWKSEKLSFSSGGDTTYGWQGTLDRYKRSYAPPKEMGQLHFDHLEVSPIESKSALVLGHWHLKMKDGSTRDGNFSLVLKKLEDGWKIIHDHSSLKEPEEENE